MCACLAAIVRLARRTHCKSRAAYRFWAAEAAAGCGSNAWTVRVVKSKPAPVALAAAIPGAPSQPHRRAHAALASRRPRPPPRAVLAPPCRAATSHELTPRTPVLQGRATARAGAGMGGEGGPCARGGKRARAPSPGAALAADSLQMLGSARTEKRKRSVSFSHVSIRSHLLELWGGGGVPGDGGAPLGLGCARHPLPIPSPSRDGREEGRNLGGEGGGGSGWGDS